MRLIRQLGALMLAVCSACAPAQVVTTPAPSPVAGTRIRYSLRTDSSAFVTARVLSVGANRLVFERYLPGDPYGRWLADSLEIDSVAQLQVRIGRRSHAGRGALLGGVIGAALGLACAANEDAGQWLTPTPEECLVSGTLTGVGVGLLIGAVSHSDVWAPTVLPRRELEQPPEMVPPPVSAAPIGIGIRVPIRFSAP